MLDGDTLLFALEVSAVVLLLWLALAAGVSLVVGRGARIGEQRARQAARARRESAADWIRG